MNTQNLWKKIQRCFNVRKFMHYCTYDLVAFFRYDLVVRTGRFLKTTSTHLAMGSIVLSSVYSVSYSLMYSLSTVKTRVILTASCWTLSAPSLSSWRMRRVSYIALRRSMQDWMKSSWMSTCHKTSGIQLKYISLLILLLAFSGLMLIFNWSLFSCLFWIPPHDPFPYKWMSFYVVLCQKPLMKVRIGSKAKATVPI